MDGPEAHGEPRVDLLVAGLHVVLVFGWLGWAAFCSWFGVDHPSLGRTKERLVEELSGPLALALNGGGVAGSLVIAAVAAVLLISFLGRRSPWVAPLGLLVWPIWFASWT